MGKFGVTEWILILFFGLFYFVPTFIAFVRNAPSKLGVFLLNFFLGWTFLGWIGALIWACVSKNPVTVIVNNHSSTERANMSNPSKDNSYDEKLRNLEKLKSLYDSGTISEEEFGQQKAKILQ